MADWNKLPTELLIKIFAELDYNTRLNCKIVCQRWLEVLMTDFQFIDDRTLDLRDCSVAHYCSPYQILLDAPYKYNGLILNEESIKFEEFEDVRVFWESVGKLVTFVKYEGLWNSKLVMILASFNSLKSFQTHEKDLLHGMAQLSTEFLSKGFQNVETLTIDSLNCDIQRIFKKLKTINYIKGNFKYKTKATKESIPLFTNNVSIKSNNQDIEIIEFEHRLQKEESLNELQNFLKHNPSIKKTNLILNHIPKISIAVRIESITIEKIDVSILNHLRSNIVSQLKSLSLQNISLRNLDNFSSATVFPKVEIMTITIDRHLTETNYSLLTDIISYQKFSISRKFPNLKIFKVDLKVLRRFCSSDTPMKHVRRLSINGEARMISNFEWKKNFPNLTHLSFKVSSPFKETQQTISEIILDFKDLLPNLSYLQIIPETLDDDVNEKFDSSKFKIFNTAHRLKTLILNYNFGSTLNRKILATNLLKSSLKLNVVKLGYNGDLCFYRRHICDN